MKYGSKVAARVEELLREQLEELGENPGAIGAHPILRVSSEQHDDGSVTWRMFTRDDEGDGFASDPAGSLTRDDGPLLDMDRAYASRAAARDLDGGEDDDEDDDDDLDEDILSALLDDEDSGNDDLGDEDDEDDGNGNERRNGGYPVQ